MVLCVLGQILTETLPINGVEVCSKDVKNVLNELVAKKKDVENCHLMVKQCSSRTVLQSMAHQMTNM